MAIVGFSFSKILAEKSPAVKGKININNNVSVTDVSDAKLSVSDTKQGLRCKFSFESTYEPKAASIKLGGEIILLEDKKQADEIMKHWKKEKALPKEILPNILNNVLDRCNVEALILARDLGLPAPIPMPKVNLKSK